MLAGVVVHRNAARIRGLRGTKNRTTKHRTYDSPGAQTCRTMAGWKAPVIAHVVVVLALVMSQSFAFEVPKPKDPSPQGSACCGLCCFAVRRRLLVSVVSASVKADPTMDTGSQPEQLLFTILHSLGGDDTFVPRGKYDKVIFDMCAVSCSFD